MRKIHAEDQVINIEEIIPGKTFVCWHNEEVDGKVTIKSEPYENEDGWLIADCEGVMLGREREHIYLSGLGIVANRNGLWNRWNWLQRPSENEE